MSVETHLGDVHQLITVDGKTLTIPDKDIVFQAYGNYGAPPLEWITRTGYKQHGATKVDYRVTQRNVNVSFYRAAACSRQLYWQYRMELHDLLRPNRAEGGGALTLVLRQAGGQKRALTVYANPGAMLPPEPDRNNWSINEPLDFVAFDPFWFDPDTVSADVSLTVDANLIFPITFPIQFGTNGAQFVYPIVYTGTWESYPTLTLTGPYTSARVENLATGISIELLQGISEGENRIINLTPGSQSIKDAAGVNRFSDLSPDANLINFNIQPDPIVEDGIQTIRAILQGARVYMGTGWEVQTQIFAPNRWYRVDDTTATAVDLGSDASSGVYLGGYTQGVPGALAADPNTAVTLNGTTGTISIPFLPLQATSWSLNGWLKVASLAGVPVLFGANGGAGAYQRLLFGVDALGALFADFGGGVIFQSANGAFTTGAYHMISLAYDKSTGQLRGLVDAVPVFIVTAADFAAAAPVSHLGSFNNASNFVAGQIDDLQAWIGRSITNVEFLAEYASRLVADRTYTPSGFHIDFNTRYYAI